MRQAMMLLVWVGACALPGCTAPTTSRWGDWSTLRLEVDGSRMLGGQLELRIEDGVDGRELSTDASASVFGATVVRSRTLSVLDPHTGGSRRHESYSDRRGRRYVFDEEGYTVEKLEPRGDAWDVTLREAFARPAPNGDGARHTLFDYYAMLAHLRDAGLDAPGDEVTLHVATSDGVRPFRIGISEQRAHRRTFIDLASGERATVELDELRLRVVPVDPEVDEGFLNMEGETEIWVEAESKALLEISGKVPRVPGRVRLRLTAMG